MKEVNDIMKSKTILFVYPEPYFCNGGGISTYLRYAIQAHIDAGRCVKLLTWATGADGWYANSFSAKELLPLTQDDIVVVRISEDQIWQHNPVGLRAKNISDILYPYIVSAEKRFSPDLIESSDYATAMHSYLEHRRSSLHTSSTPVAIFNHGMLTDIWPASALMISDYSMRELVLEEQVITWADHVICPSEWAAKNIKTKYKPSAVTIIREPFPWHEKTVQENFNKTKFVYLGRVSFAKGIDTFSSMMSAASRDWPVDEICFIGRHVDTPFRQGSAERLINSRLPMPLRGKLKFKDQMSKDEVVNAISLYGFFGNFSRSETFSYTTLEALSKGVVPLVRTDSPMAEFFPRELVNALTFNEVPHRYEVVNEVLQRWTNDYHNLIPRIQAYAERLTSLEQYAKGYDRLLEKSKYEAKAARIYSGADITFLISSYNDSDLLRTALNCIYSQTQAVKEILILDDGTFIPEKLAILDELSKLDRVRLLRVPNMGLVAGRNYLIENCHTELAIFMDADDVILDTYIEKTLNALNSNSEKWDAVLTRRKNFGLNDHEQSGFLLGSHAHWVMNDFRMTALIKTSVLKKIRFKPEMRNGEADDWWWWLNFTIHGHQANFIPEALFHYRTEQGSMSIPWSEGQAALTGELISDLAVSAFRQGYDISGALSTALRTTYRLRRENDTLMHSRPEQVISSPAAPVNQNFISWQLIIRKISHFFGESVANKIAVSVEKAAGKSPALRKFGRFVLRGVSSLRS
ncbi:hypothetical protein DB390_29770 [Pseudomonas aeruginosa]|nr:hypothetical protein DB390_29770 [Pseudomonas aeruginosa]